MPGFDFEPLAMDEDGDPANGAEFPVNGGGDLDGILLFVIGRGVSPDNPGSLAAPNWDGTAQDIAAYTTFVTVK